MATKKKATVDAPASKKPAAKKPKKKNLPPGKTHDGRPNRAEKRAANKTTYKASVLDVKKIVEEVKDQGLSAAAPYIDQLIGRPVEWSDQLAEALYALIATGHGMDAISKMDGMPSLYRMLRWLGEDSHPFRLTYTRAKESLVPMYEELAQKLAMTSNPGEIVTERQVVTKDGDVVDIVERRTVDNVERSKLAFAGLQWTLGHLKPKKHGRAPDLNGDAPNVQLQGLFDALRARTDK